MQENDSADKESTTNGKEFTASSLAYVKSISEFPLSSPILSFGIVDASVRKYKCAFNDNYLSDELDEYDEENHAFMCVVIHMFIVQPKSVQECHVLYQPTVPETIDIGSSISSDGFKEFKTTAKPSIADKPLENFNKSDIQQQQQLLAPISEASNILTSPKPNKVDSSTSLHQSLNSGTAKPITLVTPDSFHSPGRISIFFSFYLIFFKSTFLQEK